MVYIQIIYHINYVTEHEMETKRTFEQESSGRQNNKTENISYKLH